MPATIAARRPPTLTEQLRRRLADRDITLLLATDSPPSSPPLDNPVIRVEHPDDLAPALRPPHRAGAAPSLLLSLSDLDRAIDARLELSGTWEAKALRGQGALACAVLAHHQLQQQREDQPHERERPRAPRLVLDLRTPEGGPHHAGRRLLLPGTQLYLDTGVAESFARTATSPLPRPLTVAQARHLHACLVWAGAPLSL
ncbi:hypothetical protein ACFXKR_38115 [Streptomyces violascens]|uniref:hypothetical protein n=1 Tax=Streptomyces violascens TaxID=67381 RepID=UPI0036B3158A